MGFKQPVGETMFSDKVTMAWIRFIIHPSSTDQATFTWFQWGGCYLHDIYIVRDYRPYWTKLLNVKCMKVQMLCYAGRCRYQCSIRMQMQTIELLESFQDKLTPYRPSKDRNPCPQLFPKSACHAKITPLPSHGSDLPGSFLVSDYKSREKANFLEACSRKRLILIEPTVLSNKR